MEEMAEDQNTIKKFKMLYLNENDLIALGNPWDQTLDVIKHTCRLINQHDFNQPLKPYVRFRDKSNRIIAMPAYLGGEQQVAGIKWIASFPANISHNRPRAHSVTILNDALTGIPFCIINTARISGIRTASVSGAILRKYIAGRPSQNTFDIAIIGFGPIGQLHLEVAHAILKERLGKIYIYDLKDPSDLSVPDKLKDRIIFCGDWKQAYEQADIFITATVSSQAYIHGAPKNASLHLNVSLRDYTVETRQYFNAIVVDDWEEVCRENTDIENMHKSVNLQKNDTISIASFLEGPINDSDTVMFNPMGMAVFDIAIAYWYYQNALTKQSGTHLI